MPTSYAGIYGSLTAFKRIVGDGTVIKIGSGTDDRITEGDAAEYLRDEEREITGQLSKVYKTIASSITGEDTIDLSVAGNTTKNLLATIANKRAAFALYVAIYHPSGDPDTPLLVREWKKSSDSLIEKILDGSIVLSDVALSSGSSKGYALTESARLFRKVPGPDIVQEDPQNPLV